MRYSKRIFVVLFSLFVIAILASFSYAMFVKDDVEGNILNTVIMQTKTIDDFTNTVTTTYENDQNIIQVDIVPSASYTNIYKFNVNLSSQSSKNIRIRWGNIYTNINTVNSSYGLYRCSEANYASATYANVASLCTNIGRTNYNTLPSTREERLMTADLFETIPANTTYYYVLTISITNNINKTFYANIKVDFSSNYYTLTESIYQKYTPVSDAIASTNVTAASGVDFAAISSATNGQGLYINDKINIANDPTQGSIKYFRGEVNNYVSFGGFLWRVIRINTDGSVRMITESTPITGQAFDYSSFDYSSLGYTYNDSSITTNDGTKSNAKDKLDTWYSSNLISKASYIKQNAEFCNDTTSTVISSATFFSAFNRVSTDKTPTFSCPATNKTYGGTYYLPIATITADEYAYAGGGRGTANSIFYLYNSTEYWTMSPAIITNNGRFGLHVKGEYLYELTAGSTRGFRPVIELVPGVLVTGEGTSISPWIVQ